jgi:hypothetical protein
MIHATRRRDRGLALTLLVGLGVLGSAPSVVRAGEMYDALFLTHLTSHTVKSTTVCSRPGVRELDCLDGRVPVTAAKTGEQYDVYLLVTHIDTRIGISAVTFAAHYDTTAMYVGSWRQCADSDSPQEGWPGTGVGNTVRWADGNCQGVAADSVDFPGKGTALVGAFYVYAYSPTVLSIGGPGPSWDSVLLDDCQGGMSSIYRGNWRTGARIGTIEFTAAGNTPGANPCTDAQYPGPCCTRNSCFISWPHDCYAYYDGWGVADCGACNTSVTRTTWGALKSRYD